MIAAFPHAQPIEGLIGIGWGIGGFCHPAIASLALAPQSAVIFTVAMLAGMALRRFMTQGPRWTASRSAQGIRHG